MAPTLIVSVELFPVGAPGLNGLMVPTGAPPRLNVTAPVKLVRLMATVVLPLSPRTMVSVAGVSDKV